MAGVAWEYAMVEVFGNGSPDGIHFPLGVPDADMRWLKENLGNAVKSDSTAEWIHFDKGRAGWLRVLGLLGLLRYEVCGYSAPSYGFTTVLLKRPKG